VPPKPLGLGIFPLLPVLGPCPIGPVPSKFGILFNFKFNMGIYPLQYYYLKLEMSNISNSKKIRKEVS
jgi:hypothetical protein